VDRQFIETYADLIRQLVPMDDDLYGLGAPLESLDLVRKLVGLLEKDFKARFGVAWTSVPAPQSPEDRWQSLASNTAHQFGVAIRELQSWNPWPDSPYLPRAMNDLMTELWDQGFSQTEIRDAFNQALAAMPRYAAGEEARS
jgi:hypothetical protein